MIISEKHKYIFVGLPFSASTAISKELCELYDGKTVLSKHANLPELWNKTKINPSNYVIAACLRNPFEMVYTHYSKFLYNPGERFTNEKYFVENGGHITPKARRKYRIVQKNKMDYLTFLEKFYVLPYDNYFSQNSRYLNYVLNFHDLNNSFSGFLEKIGLSQVREIPTVNKTNKDESEIDFWNIEDLPSTFHPFVNEYGHHINMHLSKVNSLQFGLYKFLQKFRRAYWTYKDPRRNIEEYGTYYNLIKQTSSKQ